MSQVTDNLATLKQKIQAAEEKYQRQPGSVRLLGVTKKQPLPKMKIAAQAGVLDFAENHVQEALMKLNRLKSLPIQWHFTGTVQSNKIETIAKYFHWVHSIDRAKTALTFSEKRSPDLPPLNILIQVNIDDEPTKSGVALEELSMIAEFIKDLPNIKFRGLMAIPAPKETFEEQRESFAKLRQAMEHLKANGFPDLDTLSMGMSNDYEAAIAEGSTIVRIGTALFGQRIGVQGL